jgi:hypothetical protein
MNLQGRRSNVGGERGFDGASWFRRGCLGAMALILPGIAMTAWAQAPQKVPKGEQEVVDQVQMRAKKAGLEPFERNRKPQQHFLAIGDAPARFREDAIKLCEAVGKDFLSYFRRREFKVAYPEQRLTVVTLKDSDSFKAYINDNPDEVVAGQYELDSNQLIMFDLRDVQTNVDEDKKRQNTLALAHETIHLLCFNTGLLSREADVPLAISEGLATYGELWVPPRDAKAFGETNMWRLQTLDGAPWIPISELLSDDKVFDDPKTAQVAYAEAWLLVHYLLQPQQVRKFRSYLAEIPKLRGEKARIAYAKARLGSLEELDQHVRRHLKTVVRK